MADRTFKLGVYATAITLIMTIVNYILGHTYEKIIGITVWGGEMKQTFGFGIKLMTLYPECRVDDPIKSQTIISISPILFVLSVLALWVLLCIVFWIIDKIKGKKVSTENI